MLVMSKGALSLGQAETYYQEKYARDDYYSEAHSVTGQWYGQAASVLGLEGEVSEEQFRAILRGVDPNNGVTLVNAAAGRSERQAGWDATFNAPKSVSIQALVGGDARLTQAHRAAVERALKEIELFAQARQHRGQEWVTTANIVAAGFQHIAARPSESGAGPDPHLHSHVVIANMTIRPDGQWRSLDPIEIYRSQAFATVVYRSELAKEVQTLGYRIEITGGDEHQSEAELRLEWRSRASDYGIEIEHIARQAQSRGPSVFLSQEMAEQALQFSVEHNTEREAVIDLRALEANALQQAMGRADLDEIRNRAAEFENRDR